MFASGFSWAHLIVPTLGLDGLFDSLGISTANHVVFHSWLACFVVIGFAIVARIGLTKAMSRPGLEKYFADESLSPRTVAEVVAANWLSLMKDMMPAKDARMFFPVVGALFCYIFVSNIMGIFPGFLPPTDNSNTNVGMAIMVFVLFNFVGLTRDPVGYIKHMMGPIWLLALPLLALESFSLCVRMVTLTLRLTGNMFGDHTVFTVMSNLSADIPVIGWLIPIPVPFLALAIFVSFMQAFVFSILTAVYVGTALPHADHDHH